MNTLKLKTKYMLIAALFTLSVFAPIMQSHDAHASVLDTSKYRVCTVINTDFGPVNWCYWVFN